MTYNVKGIKSSLLQSLIFLVNIQFVFAPGALPPACIFFEVSWWEVDVGSGYGKSILLGPDHALLNDPKFTAARYRSVLVPPLCFSFMCRLRAISAP